MQIYEVTEGILKGMATPVANYKIANPSPAGFAKNAAEYFANQILNKAGISQDQQGQYDPTGHMAASMGKGATDIRQQEISIANQLSDEWFRSRTLNGKLVPNPSDDDYIEAAKLTNTASRTNLPVNYKNILADIDRLKNQKNAAAQQQKANSAKTQPGYSNVNMNAPTYNAANVMKTLPTTPAATAPAVMPQTYNASNVMNKQKAAPKISAPPPAGAPTPAEYANLDKRLQQALAAQKRKVAA